MQNLLANSRPAALAAPFLPAAGAASFARKAPAAAAASSVKKPKQQQRRSSGRAVIRAKALDTLEDAISELSGEKTAEIKAQLLDSLFGTERGLSASSEVRYCFCLHALLLRRKDESRQIKEKKTDVSSRY